MVLTNVVSLNNMRISSGTTVIVTNSGTTAIVINSGTVAITTNSGTTAIGTYSLLTLITSRCLSMSIMLMCKRLLLTQVLLLSTLKYSMEHTDIPIQTAYLSTSQQTKTIPKLQA